MVKISSRLLTSALIYQSIIQSNFYSTNIADEARLSGAIAESVFNSKIDETDPWHQRAVGCASV